MLFLGFDIGSSSIKACVYDGNAGKSLASTQYPDGEMAIHSPAPGWAEQDPQMWWDAVVQSCKKLMQDASFDPSQIGAIGIAYQMHGLVLIDKNKQVLRPAIIWCDSRATECGENALQELGHGYCFTNLLNSPGNFIASKLRWVQQNEPNIFEKTDKLMLPGDYIAMQMSDDISTTPCGLSEGMLWDYENSEPASKIFDNWDAASDLLPSVVPNLGDDTKLSRAAAEQLGLRPGIPISYRAGDQPNNALSLNVMAPGEVAATAGTSGVLYAVTDQKIADRHSRLNTFLHVNTSSEENNLGLLLCINGTGRAFSWLRQILASTGSELDYESLNKIAEQAAIGSDGLVLQPWENGAERILQNNNPGALLQNIDFNRHTLPHIVRATHEGIVFALNHGFELLKELGCASDIIRVGHGNMFLSSIFSEAFVNTTQTPLEVYDTNGAEGAARGAAIGCGFYQNRSEAFANLALLQTKEPNPNLMHQYTDAYENWKTRLLNTV